MFRNIIVSSLLCLHLAHAQETKIIMPESGLCAHRGCMDTHPENTLPAFTEAIRLGAHMIEFDIQLTKDGQMVIMHDETVDRTTNGTGKVAEMTFDEIRKLDAGEKKSAIFKGTRIPTFEETLAMMPRNVWLNCHLKGDEAVGKAAAELLSKSGRLHQAFLTSGEKASRAARQHIPDILICNGENRYRSDTPKYVAETIGMKAAFIQLLREQPGEDRREWMKLLKNNKVKVNYYYAKSTSELAALFEQGVNFILVNNLAECLIETSKMGIPAWHPQF